MAEYTISKIKLPNGDICDLIDTTYSEVTQSTSGLMPSGDKSKLDGLEIATVQETMDYLTGSGS